MKKYLLFLVVIFSFEFARADLPVHCLKKDIIGEWILELTALQASKDGRVSCGHDSPDRASTSYKAFLDEFKTEKTLNIELKEDFTVLHKEKTEEKGTWNLIYDEGFELELSGGHKYFTFFSYIYDHHNADNSVSVCNKTVVGWYINTEKNEKRCFRGRKANLKSDVFEEQGSIPRFSPKYKRNILAKNVRETHENILKSLNEKKKSWQADLNPMFAEMSLKQMNKFAGRRKFALNAKSSGNKDFKHFSRENVEDLPKEFNWKSLIQDSIRQGECGSCYTFATMEMAQARIKKKYNETVKLSVQYSLNCNYYNQGCEGGYPTLVSKFGSEFQFVDESCLKYTAKNGKCSDSCDVSALSRVYKVKNYWFVGGNYGKCSERAMMLELMNKGPFVVSFEPNMEFMYYKKGIFHSVLAAEWIVEGKDQPSWEKVDHSVLLVGWGEEDGEKYWILQNSWGTNWGENGLFRMRRGTDESGIESMGEAAEIEIVEQKKKSSSLIFRKKGKSLFSQ